MRWLKAFLVAAFLLAVVAVWLHWLANAPRRVSSQALQNLLSALVHADTNALLHALVLPQMLVNKTPGEQAELLGKVLYDELSAEGLDELRKHARFGPLQELFPEEAKRWADAAAVPVDKCFAFRLDRPNGLRAEVVLHKDGDQFRIVRCNNVK